MFLLGTQVVLSTVFCGFEKTQEEFGEKEMAKELLEFMKVIKKVDLKKVVIERDLYEFLYNT